MTKSDLETEELLLYRRPQRDHSIRAVIRAVLDTSVPACALLLDHSAPLPTAQSLHSLHTLITHHSLARSLASNCEPRTPTAQGQQATTNVRARAVSALQ
jgi:hypothetical protein